MIYQTFKSQGEKSNKVTSFEKKTTQQQVFLVITLFFIFFWCSRVRSVGALMAVYIICGIYEGYNDLALVIQLKTN